MLFCLKYILQRKRASNRIIHTISMGLSYNLEISACGRQFFKNAQRGKALALAQSLADMSVVTDTVSAQVYKIAYRNILIPPSSVARVEGTMAFYRSDMLVSKVWERE